MKLKQLEETDLELGLASMVRRFAERHPEYATPEGAFDQCQAASAAFIDYLVERKWLRKGGNGREWAVQEFCLGGGRPWPTVYPDKAYYSHYVARVGHRYFDWTARQFKADAPFPLMLVEEGGS